ncbi:hypothetical protein F5B20DRAFT_527934 [Whalleya microplaca]|nr:hypothetical protein F5B20DRAFT_527934 [Whalleya microplaca]
MASRQKSCVPCAKAKRRCVPETPQCSRCANRGVRCYYKNQPLKDLNQRRERKGQCGSIRRPSPEDTAPILESTSVASVSDDDASLDRWTRIVTEKTDISSVQETYELDLRHVQMPGFHPGCPILVKTTDRWPIETLSRRIMAWPERFICKLEAPFIHSSLHDAPSLPLPLEEAFSACASYATKTLSTKSIAMSIIEKRVHQLIGLDLSTLSIESHLAALQAFLILHIIQLWDGDVRQRAQAEMHSYIIESWALELHMRVISRNQDSALTWEQWITLESARRTAIMTLLAQGIYEMAKFGVCSYVPNMAEMSFTTEDGPWNAKTSKDWEEAVRYMDTSVANYLDYTNTWRESAGGSPSAFGKLLLMPCLGSKHKGMLTASQVGLSA